MNCIKSLTVKSDAGTYLNNKKVKEADISAAYGI